MDVYRRSNIYWYDSPTNSAGIPLILTQPHENTAPEGYDEFLASLEDDSHNGYSPGYCNRISNELYKRIDEEYQEKLKKENPNLTINSNLNMTPKARRTPKPLTERHKLKRSPIPEVKRAKFDSSFDEDSEEFKDLCNAQSKTVQKEKKTDELKRKTPMENKVSNEVPGSSNARREVPKANSVYQPNKAPFVSNVQKQVYNPTQPQKPKQIIIIHSQRKPTQNQNAQVITQKTSDPQTTSNLIQNKPTTAKPVQRAASCSNKIGPIQPVKSIAVNKPPSVPIVNSHMTNNRLPQQSQRKVIVIPSQSQRPKPNTPARKTQSNTIFNRKTPQKSTKVRPIEHTQSDFDDFYDDSVLDGLNVNW